MITIRFWTAVLCLSKLQAVVCAVDVTDTRLFPWRRGGSGSLQFWRWRAGGLWGAREAVGLTHRAADGLVLIFLTFTNSVVACSLRVFILFFEKKLNFLIWDSSGFFCVEPQLILKSVVDVSSQWFCITAVFHPALRGVPCYWQRILLSLET